MGTESPVIEVEGDVPGAPGFVHRVGLGATRLHHRRQAMAERSMAQLVSLSFEISLIYVFDAIP